MLDNFLVEIESVPDNFLRGDANQSSTVEISDAIGVLNYLFLGQPNTCLDALDVNDDGNVSISDPLAVLCWLFCAGSPPPPEPFPGCGFDQTFDSLDCESFDNCL